MRPRSIVKTHAKTIVVLSEQILWGVEESFALLHLYKKCIPVNWPFVNKCLRQFGYRNGYSNSAIRNRVYRILKCRRPNKFETIDICTQDAIEMRARQLMSKMRAEELMSRMKTGIKRMRRRRRPLGSAKNVETDLNALGDDKHNDLLTDDVEKMDKIIAPGQFGLGYRDQVDDGHVDDVEVLAKVSTSSVLFCENAGDTFPLFCLEEMCDDMLP